MKKAISLFIGIIAITGIISLTTYTLMHKDFRNKIVTNEESFETELISSNLNSNTLSEIYNIYLNKQRHKIKFEYNVRINQDTYETSAFLRVYFDGGNIITEDVVDNFLVKSAKDLFQYSDINTYVKIKLDDIQILKIKNKDYVLLKVGYFDSRVKEKYYLFDDNGDLLIRNGVVIKDNRFKFTTFDDKNLDVFYELNNEEQIMGKFENNMLYGLQVLEHEEDDLVNLVEYVYYFKDDEFVSEELKTYPDVKRVEREKQVIDILPEENDNENTDEVIDE